jgi:hypothetical protein
MSAGFDARRHVAMLAPNAIAVLKSAPAPVIKASREGGMFVS